MAGLKIFTPVAFVLLLLTMGNASCISKKKFAAELSSRDSVLAILNTRIIALNREIALKDLEIAEQNGENKALYIIHDKLEARIKNLEKEIENLINKSLSQQEMASVMLEQKREEAFAREQFILGLKNAFEKQEKALQIVSDSLAAVLSIFPASEINHSVKDRQMQLSITDKVLFKPGTAELLKDGLNLLNRIAEVLQKNPQYAIEIEGHTDNSPLKNREYRDNWDFSTFKANAVARYFATEYGINPSQVTPSGKGEYQPRTSNETPEGKASNKRIVIKLKPTRDEVLKLLLDYH
jgi:chemotaxis protein MotB